MENRKIIIFVDSTSDLSKEIKDKYGIIEVPLHISFPNDDKDYLDGVNIDTKLLYELIEKHNAIPNTGARNVSEFIDDFTPYIEQGYDILYTGIGSDLSSTYNNACLAAKEFPEGRIEIIDSKSLSTGSGLLAIKMGELVKEGLNIHQIAEKIRNIVPLVIVQSVVDNLKYLHKSGRCKGVTRLVASILKLHPVVRVVDGKLGVYKLSRGKNIKGVDIQIEDFKEDLANDNVDLSSIVVIDSYETNGEENYLYDEISKLVPSNNIYRLKAGCIVASHCGSHTIGLYYIKKKLDRDKKKG